MFASWKLSHLVRLSLFILIKWRLCLWIMSCPTRFIGLRICNLIDATFTSRTILTEHNPAQDIHPEKSDERRQAMKASLSL